MIAGYLYTNNFEENLYNALKKVLQQSHHVHLKFSNYLVDLVLTGRMRIRNDLKSRIRIQTKSFRIDYTGAAVYMKWNGLILYEAKYDFNFLFYELKPKRGVPVTRQFGGI